MTAAFKEGDRVRIVDREATAEDLKSGLFYNHFRGVSGTVQKVYATEVAVEVDQSTLSEAVATRESRGAFAEFSGLARALSALRAPFAMA